WLFISAGFYQMYIWAVKKHKAYRKEFKDYPKNRTAIIPFV
ncbi:23457_t:CDS:1, partial [Racocetra persica]